MRKSLPVILIILFIAPILASCAPYWYGYGPYGYGGYYDPGYYGYGGTTVHITHTPDTGDTTSRITDTGGTTVHITESPDTGDTAEALGALPSHCNTSIKGFVSIHSVMFSASPFLYILWWCANLF